MLPESVYLKFLQRAVRAANNGEPDMSTLAHELAVAERVAEEAGKLRVAGAKLLVQHQTESAAHHEAVTKVQKACSHLATTHHSDPSGNNDSYDQCDICGAYV